jgi:hypothetical protein
MSSSEKTPGRVASGSFLRLARAASVVALLSAIWLAPAHAADQEYFKAYTVTGRAHVRVHADDSSVRVVTSDTNQVEFHARMTGSDWGLHIGEPPHVESHQDGDLVELTAQTNWHIVIGASSKHMTVEVRMPKNADLELDTGDGSVELSSLNGNIMVHTSDGGIRAAQLEGKIELRTSDGSIIADGLSGEMRLHTSDGRIRGSNLTGRCEAGSNDGSIQVQGRFDLLNLRSGDGSITARAEPGSQISSAWSLHTSDGSVRLALPKDFKASLDASTADGHISSDLPVQVQGEMSRRSIHGTLNGGGPVLTIRSGDGSIDLTAI